MEKKNTIKIFQKLQSGAFICSDSSDRENGKLYQIIKAEFDAYKEFFGNCGYILESGIGFYYLSKEESNMDVQRKLEQFLKIFLRGYDLLLLIDSSFTVGTRFATSDITSAINNRSTLKQMLEEIYPNSGLSYDAMTEKFLKELASKGFLELVCEVDNSWRVLSSFRYVEDLIGMIKFKE